LFLCARESVLRHLLQQSSVDWHLAKPFPRIAGATMVLPYRGPLPTRSLGYASGRAISWDEHHLASGAGRQEAVRFV